MSSEKHKQTIKNLKTNKELLEQINELGMDSILDDIVLIDTETPKAEREAILIQKFGDDCRTRNAKGCLAL